MRGEHIKMNNTPKRHKTLETLIERATRKGEAQTDKWHVMVQRDATGNFTENGNEIINCTYIVRHYGTPVLHIVQRRVSSGLAPSAGGHDLVHSAPVLGNWYGESRSDADALNTVCALFGMPDRFTFRPVNGGFKKVES